jgi:hypothetical protein
MNDSGQNYFITYDLFLSSTLVTLGFRIDSLGKQDKQKVSFYFQRERGLDEAVQSYWAKSLLVEPQAFAANLKMVKNRIYSQD